MLVSTTQLISLVSRLLEPYAHQGHGVYMDRHCSSPAWFPKSLDVGFVPVGTAQKNCKNLPKVFAPTNILKGQCMFRRKSRILATKWKDVRNVITLSCKNKALMWEAHPVRRVCHNHETFKPETV